MFGGVHSVSYVSIVVCAFQILTLILPLKYSSCLNYRLRVILLKEKELQAPSTVEEVDSDPNDL